MDLGMDVVSLDDFDVVFLTPYDQFIVNDIRMYFPWGIVTGVHLCDVRERLPTCTHLTRSSSSRIFFREVNKKNPVTLVRGPPVRERGDDVFSFFHFVCLL
jgi:hypothetical protein